MNLKYSQKENFIVIYLESAFDLGTSPQIQKDISSLISQFPDYDIILNMSGVEYMNSAGLGVLIFITKRLEKINRSLKITNLNTSIKKVIQLLEADDIINIYENEEEALKSLPLCS